MLSRVADNLYWFGRYIERTEHVSRFLRVQYFSSLEIQSDRQIDLALKSILSMVDVEHNEDKLLEEYALVSVAMDMSNPLSIKSCIQNARENLRGSRDHISTELWQLVNKYYRFIVDYPEDYYKTQGLYEFTQKALENSAIIKHSIQSSMLHDEAWAFMKMGLHLERAIQILRIILIKLQDIQKLEENEMPASVISYELATLLKSVEALDMYKRVFRTSPSTNQVLEFLVLNTIFSRSVTYNMASLQKFLLDIRPNRIIKPNSVTWNVGRTTEYLKYCTTEDIEKKPVEFLTRILNQIYNFHNLLTKEYLLY
jgi:uncharacterized alpha-E superfamily protein